MRTQCWGLFTRCLAAFLAVSTAAFGADREFDSIVHAIESHYGTTRTQIPFMGVASLFVKVARPAGTSDFKLAVFQDLESAPGYRAGNRNGYTDHDELDNFMSHLSVSGMRPIVRVHSRRDGESTYIYSGEIGRSTKMLLATFQRNQATVIEVKVNMATLLNWIKSPELAGKSFSVNEDR
jgi:hypothetical protein